ncbi:cysteine-rich CWC family protein [Colwellia sp. E150_009]
MQNQVDPTACPFCQSMNNCMVKSKTPCWCNTTNIPNDLTAMVPIPLRRKSCICANCVNLFNKNPDQFKREYSLTNTTKYAT